MSTASACNHDDTLHMLEVECAVRGLRLRVMDAPEAGSVIVAGPDEQLLMPDGCSFISTVLPDGSREYRISEAVPELTDEEKLEAIYGGVKDGR